MLKKLRIQNFKIWEDTGEIELAPLTLLFGTNSSGKSSIGQFLMMLKQTVNSYDKTIVFNLGSVNDSVQLGSFKEMISHHDVSKNLEFSYSWDLNDRISFKDTLNKTSYTGDSLKFEGNIFEQNSRLQVESFKYSVFLGEHFKFSISAQKDGKNGGKYKYAANGYDLKRYKGRVWDPTSLIQFYGMPNELNIYYQNISFAQTFNLFQEKLFKSISYLGPMRNRPDRFYIWQGEAPDSVGYYGEKTVNALLASSKEKIINITKRTKKYTIEEMIAYQLARMGLIDDFKIEQIAKGRREYEIKVKTSNANDWVTLADVGFGVSQVLPVLTQCFYAPNNSIILIEQPEIHLHPCAQSILADVMIDVVKSRKNNEARNIQLIIETHSEHFLRRIQRRIAEREIDENLIKAYFASNYGKTGKLEKLQIDLYGNIKNWPENFFGDEMGDVVAHSKAVLKRRKDEK